MQTGFCLLSTTSRADSRSITYARRCVCSDGHVPFLFVQDQWLRRPCQCAEARARAAEIKTQGNQLFKRGKYRAAIDMYTDAVLHDPELHVLYVNRALCYRKLSNWQQCEADARTAIELRRVQIKACSSLIPDAHTCVHTNDGGGLHNTPEHGLRSRQGLHLRPSLPLPATHPYHSTLPLITHDHRWRHVHTRALRQLPHTSSVNPEPPDLHAAHACTPLLHDGPVSLTVTGY